MTHWSPVRAVLRQQLAQALAVLYDPAEAAAIVRHLFDDLLGPAHRTDNTLDAAQWAAVQAAIPRLLAAEPLQYVTGRAAFYGRTFAVTSAVLIPRPETEELVQHVRDTLSGRRSLHVLDVGTGSGCIPITLWLEWQARGIDAHLTGLDLSREALAIAATNADQLGARVSWVCDDLFGCGAAAFAGLDAIVSNPPYIPAAEYATMHDNVRAYEPAMALFVPDDDPLCFYRHLATVAPHWLRPGGCVFAEIHHGSGAAQQALWRACGADRVEILPDLQGRERIVQAQFGGGRD
ncbi:MAG: peptide chain release factor N(5)-glutamine methyltransferase [Bacteroidia bacterium]